MAETVGKHGDNGENDELYRLLFEGITDAVFVHGITDDNQPDRFLAVNDAACQRLGYTREELLNMSARDIDAPESPVDVRPISEKLVKGESVLFEQVHVAKDGRRIPVEIHVRSFLVRGRPMVLSVVRDITSRKEADERLRETELKYRSLVETTDTGYVILDANGIVIDANQEYVRLTGRNTMGQVMGHSLLEWTAPHDHSRNAAEVGRCLEKGFVRNLEVDYLGPDGRLLPVEINATVLRRGESVSILSLVRDIGKRKQTEERIELLSRSIDAHYDGAYWMDAANRFVYVNEAGCKAVGYSREELIGKGIDLVNPYATEERMTQVWNTLREKGFLTTEAMHRRKDGSEFPVDIVCSYVTFSGKEYNCGFARDITDRKRADAEKERLQEQLLQSQKMESVGRLAGGVAHDFNNMLGVILGYIDLIIRRSGADDPNQGKFLEIRKAAERSADLTRQLLAFARKQTVSPQVLNLNETVSGMLKMLRRLIGEEIDLVWKPGENIWPVRIDPSQIDQILANLCVNARDAIDGIGRVTIETGNLTVDRPGPGSVDPSPGSDGPSSGFVPGDYVVLKVSDTGCGMGKDTLAKLFEPFFTTKEVGKGTGLGLATVYGIVKQNRGFIIADSVPGGGTTFTISLPRHVGKMPAAGTAHSAGTVAGGLETVLLVEDERAILDLIRLQLEQLGYRVLPARTPGEAVQLAIEHPGEIHLLLTDVIMPEMDGRDLAKRLLSLYPGIRRLFMSGYPAEIVAHRGVIEEGVHLIQKPFTQEELATRVRAALQTS